LGLTTKIWFGGLILSTVGVCLLGTLIGFSWPLLVVPIITGGGLAVVTRLLIGRRIDVARSVLRQIRKHRFDNLEAVHVERGDELNGLIRQVYRTGRVLEREMGELRRAETFRKEFLGNVSHELKTPIFAIRGFAETLLDGAVDDPEVNRPFLEKIIRNSDRLNNLARDLTEISMIETGQLKMVMAPFDLGTLIAEVYDSVEPTAETRAIVLRRNIPATLPPVAGDAEHLRQVLVNLVDNAIKYNNASGIVEITARELPDDTVKISVVDNGIGIANEHIPRITERFFRVDRSRSRAEGGTGLGLAIVKHILGAHGAQLRVESRMEGGSTFCFSLPKAR
jgi:two-component system phosphate regulon sensor histidine kinase PhoR